MKKYKISLLLIISLLILISSFEIMNHISKSNDKWVRSQKKMYCYETYHGPVNPALYVQDTKYIDSLTKLYQSVENGNMNPVFNFPPLLVPTDTCVYVLGYNKDSTIVKIEFYMRYGERNLTQIGYVYSHTLHLKKRLWIHHILKGRIKY